MLLAFVAFAGDAIQLVPDGTILFHLILIIGMVALLNATLLKPINRVLEERDRRTRGRLSEAAETLQTVDARLREYEQALRQARGEGYAAMERERATLSSERERQLAGVRSEVAERLTAEKGKLAQEAAAVKSNLGSEAERIAQEISSRILRRPI